MCILVIDDNIETLNLITNYLRISNFEVKRTLSGLDGLIFLEKYHFNLIILDLFLEDITGDKLIEKIRETGDETPILILSSCTDNELIQTAFEKGGNGYLNKYLWFDSLKNKINEITKKEHETNCLSFRNIKIDYSKSQVFLDKKEIKLESKEYLVLKYLLENKERIISKEEIIDNIWGLEINDKCSVENTVSKLRKKMKLKIKKKYKIGYYFDFEENRKNINE